MGNCCLVKSTVTIDGFSFHVLHHTMPYDNGLSKSVIEHLLDGEYSNKYVINRQWFLNNAVSSLEYHIFPIANTKNAFVIVPHSEYQKAYDSD